ncbi:MAG: hypothetical protein GY832_02440 [Chloroflexi bacterium]|nr:hypothetical protein [Chloroflexota bacterium]
MNKRLAALMTILTFFLLACSVQPTTTEAPYSGELYAMADALSVRETEEAQGTRQALEAQAKGTADALALEQQGTRQAMDAQATIVAQQATSTAAVTNGNATSTAQAYEPTATAKAVQATSTAESRNATATATREAATATSQAILNNAQATVVEATSQHIARRNQTERITQPVKMIGWVLFMLAGLALLLWALFQLLPIAKVRLGTIKRDVRGDPPLLAITGAGGLVIYDPVRGWSAATVINKDVSQPLLTAPELQDGTTKRSQLVDMVKGGRPRPRTMRPGQPALQPSGNSQWEEVQQPAPVWPTRVPLSGILDGPPSVRDLILGVTVRENGQCEVIKADMGQLVHVAVGGSSGWGKSVFLRSLAFQLAQSVEPVELALVDLEGATFAPFAECSRLLYPVADTEQNALAIFQELMVEMNRRKALYADFPGVDSLKTYNAKASDPLAPLICLVDEATALLADKSVENAIRMLVLRARKYGLWCVLGGQDWKASSLDTAIRNQLASRFQFKAMSASQSRVLLQRNGAELLDAAGRALAIIPGREMIKLQAPLISYQDIITATHNGGPRHAMPQVDGEGLGDEQTQLIRELAEQGLSKRQIGLEVFGYAGGKAHRLITEALEGCTTVPDLCTEAGT